MSDLHATILHQLGLNDRTFTYDRNDRDERLTDVYEAKALKPLLS